MINKLCFTTCLNEKFIPGAMGTISSIRKFYDPADVDIVVFIDNKFPEFEDFCLKYSVGVQYFNSIEKWVLEKIYSQDKYKNDKMHYYHPEFAPHPDLPKEKPGESGFNKIRHLHPLNVKAYCTGYCLLVKEYKRVVHIDSDAFLLGCIDEIFDQYKEEDTVIGFDDGTDNLEHLTHLYGISKPDNWTPSSYGFNAGVVFYINGPNVKVLMEEFCFYIESCYHYDYSGYFADQGILRALVAKNHINGLIKFHRLDAVNWNPTWNRSDELEFQEPQTWINKKNNQPQRIWHGAGGEKTWTGRYKSPSVNAAWTWVGGVTNKIKTNWQDVKGSLPPSSLSFLVEQLHLFFGGKEIKNINCLEIGTQYGRTSVGFCYNMKELGYNIQIDTCDIFSPSSDYPQNFATQKEVLDNITEFQFEKFITSHKVGMNENLVNKFKGKKFNFIYIDACHEYKQVIADIIIAQNLITKPGIIIGDDFNLGDVKDAVHTIFGKDKISVDHRQQWIYHNI